MNSCIDIPAIQLNIESYLKKNYNDWIDAISQESAADGTYHLHLYKGGEQSDMVYSKQ